MSDMLYRVVLNREAELVNEIHRQLVQSTAQHYKDLEYEVLLRRIESLVAYFLMSLRKSPELFINYIAEIADERIAEGFSLAETLLAMRILEEKVWLVIVEDVPLPERTTALARVTVTIGAAKDNLAITYVRQTAQDDREVEVTDDLATGLT